MDLAIYQQVKRNIKSLLGINLDHYKDEQMRRRLDAWLVRAGAPTWGEYFRRVKADEGELSRFRNYLTINVSAFFRDAERWQTLREQILPGLLKTRPRLRLWSAGCSIGPEPYSLAMLLEELTPGRAHTLLASDLDRGALAHARNRGPYTADDIKNVTAAQRARFWQPGGPPYFIGQPTARRVTTFRELNLLDDEFEGDFDLILCRNVVIYFTDQAKALLYRKFQAALRPGGILFIGGTETIPQPQAIGLRSVAFSFYERC
jgi:chemotaxis protein methyltransferase CheR